MRELKLILTFSLVALLFFTSCESVDDAQVVADEFYVAFNTENESKMETLLDKETVIDGGVKNDFYNVFNQHWNAFGKVTSYKRYGFSSNTNNGLNTVLLKFNCNTEKGSTVYEKLRFVQRTEGYKIIQFEYNIDKSVIDKTESN